MEEQDGPVAYASAADVLPVETPPSQSSTQGTYSQARFPSQSSNVSPMYKCMGLAQLKQSAPEFFKPGYSHQFHFTRPASCESSSRPGSSLDSMMCETEESSDDQNSEENLAPRFRIVEEHQFVLEEIDSDQSLDSDIEIVRPSAFEEKEKEDGRKYGTDIEMSLVERLNALLVSSDDSDNEEHQRRRIRREKKKWSAGILLRDRSRSDTDRSYTDYDTDHSDNIGAATHRRKRRRTSRLGAKSSLIFEDVEGASSADTREVEEPKEPTKPSTASSLDSDDAITYDDWPLLGEEDLSDSESAETFVSVEENLGDSESMEMLNEKTPDKPSKSSIENQEKNDADVFRDQKNEKDPKLQTKNLEANAKGSEPPETHDAEKSRSSFADLLAITHPIVLEPVSLNVSLEKQDGSQHISGVKIMDDIEAATLAGENFLSISPHSNSTFPPKDDRIPRPGHDILSGDQLDPFPIRVLSSLGNLYFNLLYEAVKSTGDLIVPEKKLAAGSHRLRWTCKCGKRLYDDFIEVKPGSLLVLERNLAFPYTMRLMNSLMDNVNQRNSGGSGGSGDGFFGIGAFLDRIRGASWSRRSNQKQQSTDRLPTHNLSARTRNTEANPPSANSCSLHLLLCIHSGKFSVDVRHENIDAIKFDRDLFDLLRKRYASGEGNQGRSKFLSAFSLRTVSRINLVKFATDMSAKADIHAHATYCSSNTCTCLPPSSKVAPAPNSEYICNPIPAPHIPPIGENYMMHLYSSPECIDASQVWVYNQIPKRTRGVLVPRADAPAEGWGLHFEQGWHWPKIWTIIAILFLGGSLLFGVLYATLKKDAQSAFGIASYWIAAATILVGYLATKNA